MSKRSGFASKLFSHVSKSKSDDDVEDDRLSDNSTFSDYNDEDISVTSSHLSKQLNKDEWREERRKTSNFAEAPTIGDLVREKSRSMTQEMPSLTFEEIKDQTDSKERSESITSTCSDWFNTTREEMILYEKFGEDYDIIVGKMSHQEKIELKEEVSKATPKSVEELLGDDSFESATTGASPFKCSGNFKTVPFSCRGGAFDGR